MANIIVVGKEYDYVPNIDFYDFIDQLYQIGHDFIIYHVKEDEFEELGQNLNKNLKMPFNRYMMGYNRLENTIEIANYDHDYENYLPGRYYINHGVLEFDKDSVPFTSDNISLNGFKIYTTETYKDVLKHYDLNKISGLDESIYIKILNKLLDSRKLTEEDYQKLIIDLDSITKENFENYFSLKNYLEVYTNCEMDNLDDNTERKLAIVRLRDITNNYETSTEGIYKKEIKKREKVLQKVIEDINFDKKQS